RGNRHRDAARRASSNGPARAGRFHRARHLPVRHAGAARGFGGFQVSAVPVVGEVCRGRLARPQDATRFLRLSRRKAGADTLNGYPTTNDRTGRERPVPEVRTFPSLTCALMQQRPGGRVRYRALPAAPPTARTIRADGCRGRPGTPPLCCKTAAPPPRN